MILQNRTKQHAKFLAKKWLFPIMDFGLKYPKKNPNEPQEVLMRSINYVFWMELNITLKILSFYIPSFHSSWHFVFYIF